MPKGAGSISSSGPASRPPASLLLFLGFKGSTSHSNGASAPSLHLQKLTAGLTIVFSYCVTIYITKSAISIVKWTVQWNDAHSQRCTTITYLLPEPFDISTQKLQPAQPALVPLVCLLSVSPRFSQAWTLDLSLTGFTKVTSSALTTHLASP